MSKFLFVLNLYANVNMHNAWLTDWEVEEYIYIV